MPSLKRWTQDVNSGNDLGAIESLCNAGLAALLGLRLDDARMKRHSEG